MRWGPGTLQLADGLTKDKEEPALRLRAALRTGRFQLAREDEALRQAKEEKERRERQKASQGEDDVATEGV